MVAANAIWWRLLRHRVLWAFNRAFDNAGSNMAANTAMMAITTSNSISVKPERVFAGRCSNRTE